MKLLPFISARIVLFTCLMVAVLTSCKKTEYLDTDNADRPPLSAKVKLVNALTSNAPVNFLDFTRQINTASIAKNGFSADYLDSQFGKVQYNTVEGTGTTYQSSYVFGGGASFVQETDKASFAGPNGPIATYYHTLFAVPKRKPSKLNPGNRDSLILVYDDLTAPSAGKAKVRFANFSPDAPKLDLAYVSGALVFAGVNYGTFGDQTQISYDVNGKAPVTIPGLTWKTLGPFKEVDAGNAINLEIRDNNTHAIIPVNNNVLTGIRLEQGKIYTIFISGKVASASITAVLVSHN